MGGGDGIDLLEILNKEIEEHPAQGPENPYLDEDGKPYHDRPEEEDCD